MSVFLQKAAMSDPGAVITPSQSVPSGQDIELFEVLIDRVGSEDWVRFRFLMPEIGTGDGTVTYSQVQDDFEHLCLHTALPYLDQFDVAADVIVIALADRPVEFGQSDAAATQFFEAFRLEDGGCVWEGI